MKPLSRQFEFRQVFNNEITLLLFRFLFISKINEVSLLRFLRTFSVMRNNMQSCCKSVKKVFTLSLIILPVLPEITRVLIRLDAFSSWHSLIHACFNHRQSRSCLQPGTRILQKTSQIWDMTSMYKLVTVPLSLL